MHHKAIGLAAIGLLQQRLQLGNTRLSRSQRLFHRHLTSRSRNIGFDLLTFGLYGL